jgi:DNA-binding GntR family transcriptional regulator
MVQPRKIFQSSYKIKRKKFLNYINSKTFPGRKLPNESDLAKILGMSLGTIREILRELEMTGTVTKMKGKGNFLNASSQSMKMRIDLVKEFSELIEGKGFEVSFETFAFRGKEDSRLMKLGAKFFPELMTTEDYRLIGNVYFADLTPAVLSVFLVPVELMQADMTEKEFVSSYWEEYIQTFDHAGIKWEVGVVSEMLTEFLKLPIGLPIQMWNEIHYNKYDELICCSYSYFNPEIMEMSMVRK